MNEEGWLQAVKQFERLDLAADEQLKQTVASIAKLCRTPIACITLLDEDTQWIKVNEGLDVVQTPRELSFCTNTIKKTAF